MKIKKGFTLVELLAVIIILGIVVTISIPIVKNIIKDSKINSGLSEANLIYKEISKYCDTEEIHEGVNNYDKICTNGNTIKQNIDKIIDLGNVNILDIEYKEDKINWIEIESNGYKFGLQDGEMILDAKKPFSLIETLLKQYKEGNTVGLLKDGSRYYYKGTKDQVANNFLWYGGHQWRILEFDTDNKTLKLITQQPLTTRKVSTVWDETGNGFDNNYIDTWLNDYFYNSLPINVKENIKTDNFKIVIPSKEEPVRTGNIITKERNIGLLDQLHYELVGGQYSYLDIKNWYFLSNRASVDKIQAVYKLGYLDAVTSKSDIGIRPVMTISDVYINDGNGTLTDNFRLHKNIKNNSQLKIGDYIKLPYGGNDKACGDDNMCIFRISNKDNDSLKITLNGVLKDSSHWANDGKDYLNLNDIIFNEGGPLRNFEKGIKKYIYNGNNVKQFGIGDYLNDSNYEEIYKVKLDSNIGFSVIGEMFTTNDIELRSDKKLFVDDRIIENPYIDINIPSKFWTMNRIGEFPRAIDYYGNIVNKGTTSNFVYIRPSVFINNNIKIIKGDGSPSEPFEVD